MDEQVGYKDLDVPPTGSVLYKESCEETSLTDEDEVVIKKDNHNPGFKAMYKGKVVLSRIRHVGSFYDGIATVFFIGERGPAPKHGYINRKGEIVIPCEYDWVSDFRNNKAIVLKSGKLGLIDNTGKVLIPFICERIASAKYGQLYNYNIYADDMFANRIISYSVDGVQLYASSSSGKPIDFRNGYGILHDQGLFGLFNEDLSEVLPCKYKWAVRINESEFLLREKDNLIYFNADTGDYIE